MAKHRDENREVEGAPQLQAPPHASAPPSAGQESTSSATLAGPIAAEGLRKHHGFLWQVHSYLNEYIRFSDSKSGIVIGFATVVVGALNGGGVLEPLLERQPEPGATYPIVLSSVLFLGLSVLAAVWSIRPRLWNRQPKGFIFWESIRAFEEEAGFASALAKKSESELDRELAAHTYTLATIASSKYLWSSWAIALGVVGAALGAIAALWS